MFGLHWFHGINMNTKVSDIGWTFVIIGLLFAFLIYTWVKLIKEWKR